MAGGLAYGFYRANDSRSLAQADEAVGRPRQAKDPWGNVRAAFTAKTTIERKDFGLTWNQALETGGVVVGDKVEIEAEIQAVKQVAAQVA